MLHYHENHSKRSKITSKKKEKIQAKSAERESPIPAAPCVLPPHIRHPQPRPPHRQGGPHPAMKVRILVWLLRPLRSRYNVSPENREQSQLSQLRFPAVCCLRTPFWCPLPLFYNQHGEHCLLPRVFFIIFLVSWVLWVVGFVLSLGSAQPPSALLCASALAL